MNLKIKNKIKVSGILHITGHVYPDDATITIKKHIN